MSTAVMSAHRHSLGRVDDIESRLEEEVAHLLKDIRRIGPSYPDPIPHVLFGELFIDETVEQRYEALNQTLKTAKKRGLITFKGQMLLKGAHDNVLISIVGEGDVPTPQLSRGLRSRTPIVAPGSKRASSTGGKLAKASNLSRAEASILPATYLDECGGEDPTGVALSADEVNSPCVVEEETKSPEEVSKETEGGEAMTRRGSGGTSSTSGSSGSSVPLRASTEPLPPKEARHFTFSGRDVEKQSMKAYTPHGNPSLASADVSSFAQRRHLFAAKATPPPIPSSQMRRVGNSRFGNSNRMMMTGSTPSRSYSAPSQTVWSGGRPAQSQSGASRTSPHRSRVPPPPPSRPSSAVLSEKKAAHFIPPINRSESTPITDQVNARVDEEIAQLIVDIKRIGSDGCVKFGTLFDDEQVTQYYEALVGTLKSAKKRGVIKFKGQMLLKGIHDQVMIELTDSHK